MNMEKKKPVIDKILKQRMDAALKDLSAAFAVLQTAPEDKVLAKLEEILVALRGLPQQQFCPFSHNPLYCQLPHYPCTRQHLDYTWIAPNTGTIISGKVVSGEYNIQADGVSNIALDVIGSKTKDS